MTPEMMVKVHRNGYESFIRGLYDIEHEKKEVLSEDCMGDWMYKSVDHLHKVAEKIHKDHGISHVKYEDASKSAQEIVDLVYKNRKSCHFHEVRHDVHHAVKDLDLPLVVGHILESYPELMGIGMKLHSLHKLDWEHFSDKEILKYSGEWSYLHGEALRTITGFNGKFHH